MFTPVKKSVDGIWSYGVKPYQLARVKACLNQAQSSVKTELKFQSRCFAASVLPAPSGALRPFTGKAAGLRFQFGAKG